jgi:DNA-binding NarL/FixJ family response regulator
MESLNELYPGVKVLILSMLEHERYINKVMEAGASGYVLKNAGQEELLHAIKTVASGQQYLSPEISMNLLKKIQKSQEKNLSKDRAPGIISKRELEVLKLIAEGYTNAEIAEKLFSSKRTIESHRKNLLEKTQVKNSAALIKYAIIHGIIE